MAPKYAKDQPAGFVNRIEKVALIGAGGTVGKYIAQELVKTGKHVVTALTRQGSTSKLPEGVNAVTVNYDDEQSLVSALRGHQILIITLAARAPPETHATLVKAAADAGIPYVMPNAWGNDPSDEKLQQETMMWHRFADAREQIESLGLKWTSLACGFWYEFSLGGTADRYGFDFHNRTVTYFDDGNTKINTSTWAQCARAAAAFLSLKLLPEDEGDTSPTIENWANRVLHVSSFLVSQRDMFESAKRVTGTTDADWTVTHEGSEERYKKAVRDFQGGDFNGFVRLLYTRVFYPDGSGNFEARNGLDNDALGLPKEALDEATEEAIRLALNGQLSAADRKMGLRG